MCCPEWQLNPRTSVTVAVELVMSTLTWMRVFPAGEHREHRYTSHAYRWRLVLCQYCGSTLSGGVILLSICFTLNPFELVVIQNSENTKGYTSKSLIPTPPHLPSFPPQFLLYSFRFIQCTYTSNCMFFSQMIPYCRDCSISCLNIKSSTIFFMAE